MTPTTTYGENDETITFDAPPQSKDNSFGKDDEIVNFDKPIVLPEAQDNSDLQDFEKSALNPVPKVIKQPTMVGSNFNKPTEGQAQGESFTMTPEVQEEVDLEAELKKQKPYKTLADFKKGELPDVNAYNQYLANESPEAFKARRADEKKEKAAEKEGIKEQADYVKNGEFDKVDFKKLEKTFEYGFDPDPQTLKLVKDVADNKARNIYEQGQRAATLGTAIESSVADLDKWKKENPDVVEVVNQRNKLADEINDYDHTKTDSYKSNAIREAEPIIKQLNELNDKIEASQTDKKLLKSYNDAVKSYNKTLKELESFSLGTITQQEQYNDFVKKNKPELDAMKKKLDASGDKESVAQYKKIASENKDKLDAFDAAQKKIKELHAAYGTLGKGHEQKLVDFDKKAKAAQVLFDQYKRLQDNIVEDTRILTGLDKHYSNANSIWDKGNSVAGNLAAIGRRNLVSVFDATTTLVKMGAGVATLLADVTKNAPAQLGLIPQSTESVLNKLADNMTEMVSRHELRFRDPKNLLTELSGAVGHAELMLAELLVTPQLKVGKVVAPQFVTWMAVTSAGQTLAQRLDDFKNQKIDFHELPTMKKLEVLGETGKAGAIGAGVGLAYHALALGANFLGRSTLSRAGYAAAFFGGATAVEQKVMHGEFNERDIYISAMLGAGFTLHGELAHGTPEARQKAKFESQKAKLESVTKLNPQGEAQLIDAYVKVNPDLQQGYERIQRMPEGAEKTKKMEDFRNSTLENMPEKFKMDYLEEKGMITPDERELLKIAKEKVGQDEADFDRFSPKSIKEANGVINKIRAALDPKRLFNQYNLKKGVEGINDLVRDAQTIEATAEELFEIKKIMDDYWIDFARVKSAGEAEGVDRQAWGKKMNEIFGDGNVRLMTVMGRMTARQRALLLLKLVHTHTGEVLKPEQPGLTNEPVTTGEKAEIPVEGGGKFEVTLTEKLGHVFLGKTLSDIYGHRYFKPSADYKSAFWRSGRGTVNEAMTKEDLSGMTDKAEEMRNEAEFEQNNPPPVAPEPVEGPTPEELRQTKRLAAQTIEMVVGINREAMNIAADPDTYITHIKNDESLTQDEKDMFYLMIDDAVQNKGALAVKAQEIIRDLELLQTGSIPTGISAVEAEARGKVLQDKIEDKTKELRQLYKDYKPAKERADEIAEEEKKAVEELKKEVHKLAKENEVDIETPEFMAASKKLTGKEHLDEMGLPELQKMLEYVGEQKDKEVLAVRKKASQVSVDNVADYSDEDLAAIEKDMLADEDYYKEEYGDSQAIYNIVTDEIERRANPEEEIEEDKPNDFVPASEVYKNRDELPVGTEVFVEGFGKGKVGETTEFQKGGNKTGVIIELDKPTPRTKETSVFIGFENLTVKPKTPGVENISKEDYKKLSINEQIELFDLNKKLEAEPEFANLKDLVSSAQRSFEGTPDEYMSFHTDKKVQSAIADLQDRLAKKLGFGLHQGTMKGRSVDISHEQYLAKAKVSESELSKKGVETSEGQMPLEKAMRLQASTESTKPNGLLGINVWTDKEHNIVAVGNPQEVWKDAKVPEGLVNSTIGFNNKGNTEVPWFEQSVWGKGVDKEKVLAQIEPLYKEKPVSAKIAPSESFAKIPIKELTTDLEKFQGRKGKFSKQTYGRIVNEVGDGTFLKIPAVQIWRNEQGEWVILAGHSRVAAYTALAAGEHPIHEKFNKSDFERITAEIFEGTEEEARKLALESNQGAQQTDLENAGRVKELREGWKGSQKDLAQKLSDLYGKNAPKLNKLSFLNDNGHAMQALSMFNETNEGDYKETAARLAAWTGEARKRFPELTDAHENEIFDYLMQGKKDAFTKESDFLDLLNRRINGLEVFKPEEPLNLQNRIGRGANELEYVKGIDDLEKEQTKLRAEIKKVTESALPREEKNRKISELQKKVLDNEDKLTELGKLRKRAAEGDKQQISIFDQLTDDIKKDFGIREDESDYRGKHRIKDPVTTADDLLKSAPEDFLTKPNVYYDLKNVADKESHRALKQIQGKPDAEVTIYRAVPQGTTEINEGDWVSLSPTYAKEHGMHETDESKDLPVISKKVKASEIGWDGNDINEFSYAPLGLKDFKTIYRSGLIAAGMALSNPTAGDLPNVTQPTEVVYDNKSLEQKQRELERNGITSEQKEGKGILSEVLYKKIVPLGYSDGAMGTSPIIGKGKDLLKLSDREKIDPYSEDAWAMYLGLPQENNSFHISPYKPTKTKTGDTKYYYSLPKEFERDLFDAVLEFKDPEAVKKLEQLENEKYSYTGKELLDKAPEIDAKEEELKRTSERFIPEKIESRAINGRMRTWNEQNIEAYEDSPFIGRDLVLNNFTVDKGEDARGKYISYYDILDYSPKLPFDIKAESIAGKPFEVYGRIYYDETLTQGNLPLNEKEIPLQNENTDISRREQTDREPDSGSGVTLSPQQLQHITQRHENIAYGETSQNEAIQKVKIGEIDLADGKKLRDSNLIKDFEEKNNIVVGDYTFNHRTFPLDVANLFAPVRSPLIEKLSIAYYNKDNKVINIELHTCGMPDAVNIGPDYGTVKQQLIRIIQDAINMGAKGFVLNHNHPSGDPTPSFADSVFTKEVSRLVNNAREAGFDIEFGGHVVTNSNRFTYIQSFEGGKVSETEHTYEATNFHLDNYPTLQFESDKQGKMLEYAKQINEGGYKRAVVYLDTRLGLRGFDMIPDNITTADLGKKIEGRMPKLGSVRYVIVSDQAMTREDVNELPAGLADMIQVTDGKATSLGFDKKKLADDGTDYSNYQRLQEDETPYHPELPAELKEKTLNNIKLLGEEMYKKDGLMGKDLKNALKEHLRSVGAGHIAYLVDEADLPKPTKEEIYEQIAGMAPNQQTGRIVVDPILGGKPKNISEIIFDVTKGTKQRLFFSKPDGRRKSLGTYSPGNTAVKIKFNGDLDVTAHELGHSLDDHFGILSDLVATPNLPVEIELNKFSPFGSKPPTGHPDPRMYEYGEGFAEFLRALIVNPDKAKTEAPELYALYESKVDAEYKKAVEDFSNDIRTFAGASGRDMVLANVRWEPKEKPGIIDYILSKSEANNMFSITWADKVAALFINPLRAFDKANEYAKGLKGIDEQLPEDDPITLARILIGGSNDKISNIIEHGMIDADLNLLKDANDKPKNLEWLLEPLDNTDKESVIRDAKDAIAYMISERTAEIGNKFDRESILTGIGGGIFSDVEVAQKALNEFNTGDANRLARIKEAANRYRELADDVLKYMVAKGRMAQRIEDKDGNLIGGYDKIKQDNVQYVAMQRVMETEPNREVEVYSGGGKSLASKTEVVKKITGSTKEIQNPYVTLLDMVNKGVREADRNEALLAFRNLIVPEPQRSMYDGTPLRLADIGVRAKEGDAETITIFVDGKPEHWKFQTDVYKALKGMDAEVYRLPLPLTIFAKTLRWTVTNFPVFAARNTWRDNRHRMIMSNENSWRNAFGVGDLVGNKEHWNEVARAGGLGAGYYAKDREHYYGLLDQAMHDIAKNKKFILVDGTRLKEGWQGYKSILQKSETVNRVAEYRAAYRNAKAQGMDDYNAKLYAAMQARDLIDFALMGHWMKYVNQVIPFSNAQVQGLRSAAVKAKDNPAGFILRMLAMTVLPGIALWLFNHRDKKTAKQYAELPAFQRDMFDNFKIGDNLWVSAPRPFELSLVGAGIDRAMSYANGDTTAFDGFAGSVAKTVIPFNKGSLLGWSPAIAEVITNYDDFRNKNIVPPHEEPLTLALRNTERASRLGKAIQEVAGIDARKIDHFIMGQFSYYGKTALEISDIGREEEPNPFSIPDLGFFRQSPAYNSKSVQKFMKLTKEYGLTGSPEYREFQRLAGEYFDAKTNEEKDKLGSVLTDYAKSELDIVEKLGKQKIADMPMKKEIDAKIEEGAKADTEVTKTEQKLEDKKDKASDKKESVLSKLTPAEVYIKSRDSDEKVDYYANEFKDLSRAEVMKELQKLRTKKIIPDGSHDRSKIYQRIMERLQK